MTKKARTKKTVTKKATKKATKKVTKKVTKKATKKTGRKAKATSKDKLFTHKVTGMLFHEMRAACAEMEAANKQVQLLITHIAHESQKKVYEPLIRLMQSRDEAMRELALRKQTFGAVQLKLGKKFGIAPEELQNWSFDTESGVLSPPGPPPKKQG